MIHEQITNKINDGRISPYAGCSEMIVFLMSLVKKKETMNMNELLKDS